MKNSPTPKNRKFATLALCLWLVATLACDLGAGSSQSKPSPSPLQPRAAVTLPIQTPAPATRPVSTGRVYYVAVNEPNAKDSNNGLYSTYQSGRDGPWLTIRQAANMLTAGDIAYVRAGTYYEVGIRFANSGASNAPITLSNYQSEQVIVDGSKATSKSSGIEIAEGRSHFVIQGFMVRNMPRSGIMTDGDTTKPYQDITIRDCVLHNNGLSGIRLTAVDGFLVENVEAYDNAYYGLDIISSESGALSPAHGVVKNSSFHDHIGKEGHGLAINQGHDITVSDSRAYHNTIHGFDTSDMPKRGDLSYNIVFEHNVSYDNGVAGFSINSDSHHAVYRNNIAWRNGADWAKRGSSSGFLCYEGCWHVEFYNNTSVENTDAGFRIKDEWGTYSTPGDSLLIFKNNIAYNNGRRDWKGQALVVEGVKWQVVATHNNWGGASGLNPRVVGVNIAGDKGQIYTAEQVNQGAFGVSNVSVDPKLVDMPSADMRLQLGSPMIDAGTDVGIPFCGVAPDLGAIEVCP